MHAIDVLLQLVYLVCVIGLALYGLQALWLTILVLRQQPQPPSSSSACRVTADPGIPPGEWPTEEWSAEKWPHVTVQLPIYNERHVVERLISACAALDYPSDRLQIQVLDDSDDMTLSLTQQMARTWAAQGIDIEVVRREERTGFKAGALAYALPQAKGDLIAIFDADFVPPEHFLKSTVPYFLQSDNEDVGFVQTRWAHLNRAYSWLTACQALALDGHFAVEQTSRSAAGYPFGFNGSAGIWRRATIEDQAVGGWQADTLCEDLDLSYRAQFAGWRGLYLQHVAVPAEIPVQLLAFKRQQARWAKGSVQTLVKLGRRLAQQPWPRSVRLAGFGHLANYLIHPLLLAMLLLSLPMLLLDVDPAKPLALLSLFSFGPPLLYAVAQYRIDHTRWLRRWSILPLLMLVGTGLSLNNTLAVFSGLMGRKGAFLRTPKFHIQQADHRSTAGTWQESLYRLPLSKMLVGEILLSLYALVSTWVALQNGHVAAAPFLSIYAAGFGLMALTSIVQAWPASKADRSRGVLARLRTYANRPHG